MRKAAFLTAFLAIILAATTASATFDPEPKKKVLGNGATVMVLEIPDSEVVSVQVWYHVGSKNEQVGERGLAHMFEHLMFKGTRRVGPEEHARRINEVGGTVNAFTTEDVTAYHDTLPADQMELAIKLEADRMHNLLLTEDTLKSEREVVLEEKRLRVDNNPVGSMILELWDAAFKKHPYQWTAIGTAEDLRAATLDMLKSFYQRWYAPQNATIIIVGGVRADEAIAMAEKYFGKVPKADVKRPELPAEPRQSKFRDITLKRPAQLPVIVGGYHIPEAANADIPALEVLGLVLSGGESSRMYQSLVVKKHLALGAGGFTWSKEDPGLFAIYAFHLPNVPSADVRTALLAQIDGVVKKGITKRELQKAKNQLTAQYIFGLETVSGLANQLGDATLVSGDVDDFVRGPKKYEKITQADVQRVAKKYLTKDNLTLVTLVPTNPEEKK